MVYISDNCANCRYKSSQAKMAQVFQRGADSFHLFVGYYDRPKSCHGFVRAHTTSSVAVFSTQRNSRIRPLQRQRRFRHQLTMNEPAVGRQSRDSPHGVLFFECRGDGVFRDVKVSANVAHSTTIQRLCDDLVFDPRLPGIIDVDMLKTPSALFTPVALCPSFTMPIFRQIIIIAIWALYLHILLHVFMSILFFSWFAIGNHEKM